MTAGLKICSDTQRHLADWKRRQEAAAISRQTEKGRAWLEWALKWNDRLADMKKKKWGAP
jgi:hypothetical protein